MDGDRPSNHRLMSPWRVSHHQPCLGSSPGFGRNELLARKLPLASVNSGSMRDTGRIPGATVSERPNANIPYAELTAGLQSFGMHVTSRRYPQYKLLGIGRDGLQR
jgi:hypothetical protein